MRKGEIETDLCVLHTSMTNADSKTSGKKFEIKYGNKRRVYSMQLLKACIYEEQEYAFLISWNISGI